MALTSHMDPRPRIGWGHGNNLFNSFTSMVDMSVTSCAQLPRNVSFVKTSVWPTSRFCPSGEVWQQLFWQSQISTTARQLLPSSRALPVLMAIADTWSPPGTDKRMTMREWQLLWSLNTCFLTTPTCSAARSKIGVSFKVNYTSRGNKTWDFQNYINVGKENFSVVGPRQMYLLRKHVQDSHRQIFVPNLLIQVGW